MEWNGVTVSLQTKVQEEIDSVLGKQPCRMADRSKLVYTAATVLEIQRHSDIIPMGAAHVATRDVEINGHVIRKGESD